jgi:hypothetical protein
MELTQHNDSFLKDLSDDDERARSLLDLIELKMFDLELAAWCASLVSAGASWITGSGPGGVGKTTTMHSLLSFIPRDRRLARALPSEVAVGAEPHCVLCNELSDHRPPTYLWDQDLRDFFALSQQGHQLVSNVHADDLDEVEAKIVTPNSVPTEQFRAINLFIFICLEGGNPEGRVRDTTTRRLVNRIYYSDGSQPHESVYNPDDGLLTNAPRNAALEADWRGFLEAALVTEERSIEGLRRRFLE